MKYGQPVVYEGNDGPAPLAFIATKDGGPLADLLVFDENGAATVHKDVPRRNPADAGTEGLGHTWHT